MRYAGKHLEAALGEAAGGGWSLTWGDYVANEWQEWYAELAAAAARLAVLAQADVDGETSWMFAEPASVEFEAVTRGWLRERRAVT